MLNAAYGWSGKTVAQVAAEHKKRRTTKTKAGEAPAHAPVRKSEIDRMKDLFARGKAAREARAAVASEP